jgi:small-conductance mechanosensitive channel
VTTAPSPDAALPAATAPGQPTCAADAGSWCAEFYKWTNSDFLARSADTIVSTVFAVTLIILLSVVARYLIHRAINRIVEGATNSRITRLVGRGPGRRGAETGNGPATPRRAQRARTIGSVLRSISSAVILAVGAIMVLAEFGVALAPILASAGIVGVAVGFGAQNLVRDFLSGVFMLLEDQYGVGDIIDAGEASGVVEAVGLRITTLRDLSGTVWYVRNGEILRVGNKSQGYAVAVVDLPVAHAADFAQATALAERVAVERVAEKDVADSVLEPPQMLGVDRLAPEGATLRLTVKVKPGEQWIVQRALNATIADAFDDAGVPRPVVYGGGTDSARPSMP